MIMFGSTSDSRKGKWFIRRFEPYSILCIIFETTNLPAIIYLMRESYDSNQARECLNPVEPWFASTLPKTSDLESVLKAKMTV